MNYPSTYRNIHISINDVLRRSNQTTGTCNLNFECGTPTSQCLSKIWRTANSNRLFSSKEGGPKLAGMRKKGAAESVKQRASAEVSIPLSKSNKRPSSDLKLFRIKSWSADHDVLIKIEQIQKLLDKGKDIEIRYLSTESLTQEVRINLLSRS